MKIIISFTLSFFLTMILVACSSTTIKMQFNTTSHINPDFKKRALPILIRVYQLSQQDNFNGATFHQLWLNDNSVLGTTLIERQEIIVNPKSSVTMKLVPNNNANYIGIIALYRDPKHSHWRLIQAMPGKIAAIMRDIKINISGNIMTFDTIMRDK